MHGWIMALLRFFYFIFSTIFHIAGFVFSILSGKSKKHAGEVLRESWLKHVPKKLGFRTNVHGTPCEGPCLFVANHISYLDPFVILMHVKANVVAKAEILKWPLVGLAGYLIGTIFVTRDNKSSRAKTANAITEALRSGTSVLVFPEGTTSAGPGTLPFRPRSFQAAFRANVPVQPVAIKYERCEVAYINDDTFIPHFFRLFRIKEIRGRIIFGPVMSGENTCYEARQWIESMQLPLNLVENG